MRIAGYTRVSTEEQAKEGFSLDAQEERLHAYAKAQGWTLSKIYRDEGHTGRNAKRPAYQKMMAEIPEWDLVLVAKMDRVHRNTRNFIDMMETLGRKGKNFASVTESFDTSTAMGRFFMDLLQRLAQLESEVIGERTLSGMIQKAKSKGGSLGGPAPMGYLWQRDRLVIDPVGARKVAEVFRIAANPGVEKFSDVVHILPAFNRFQVRRILRNPAYAGVTKWENYIQTGTHAGIISEKAFRDIQTKFKTGVVI
jgi:site-specific DNA recombinase